MKALIITVTVAVTVFIAIQVQGNHLLEDRDELVEMLEDLGLDKSYVDKFNESVTRQLKVYCDPNMTDEAKLKKLQDCQHEFAAKMSSKEEAVILQSCTDEVHKGMTLLDIRDLDCGDDSEKYNTMNNRTEACTEAKGKGNANPFAGAKTKEEIAAKLKPILGNMISCFDAALA